MKNFIKQLREQRGLTQDELAEKVRTSAQQISRLERSERKLAQDWMERIGPALGVRPTALMDGQDVLVDRTDFDTADIKDALQDQARLWAVWRLLTEPQREMMAQAMKALVIANKQTAAAEVAQLNDVGAAEAGRSGKLSHGHSPKK